VFGALAVIRTLSLSPDPTLSSLKRAAQQGGAEDLFGQGVLSVVAEVEATGRYKLNRGAAVLALLPQHERGELAILTAWEVADARRLLESRGWSPEQGAGWARGVSHAQNLLFRFSAGG
jgi:hypothetical protein